MNCLATRLRFAEFWRRSLAGDDRGAFLTHLAECRSCDRAFRTFALAAPLLHDGPKHVAAERRSFKREQREQPALGAAFVGGSHLQPLLGLSVALVIAVSLAAYLARPPRITFEDLIVESSGTTGSGYDATDDLFRPDQPMSGGAVHLGARRVISLNQPTFGPAAPKPGDHAHFAG